MSRVEGFFQAIDQLWPGQRVQLSIIGCGAVVDVVVSKLKRFSPNDTSDIDAMVHRGLVGHEPLLERFRLAYDEFTYDARAADLPKIVGHLNQVERDMLGESETGFLSSMGFDTDPGWPPFGEGPRADFSR